ncbi:ferredoxin [Streptomyces sp. NPDC053474]|uniref:ferredoxin n=1 Tax=Streptomyces sp. NPDC053474 TaxID=3365704 RepID=UPI0037D1BB45
MRVEVDVLSCVSSGQCVMLVPEVFDQRDEDGTVELLDDTPPSELHDAVRKSAMMCPGAAIRVEEPS